VCPCGRDVHGDLLVDAFDTIESSEAVEVTILTGCDLKYGSWVSKGRSICVGINILRVVCLVWMMIIMLLLLLLVWILMIRLWRIGGGLFQWHGFSKE